MTIWNLSKDELFFTGTLYLFKNHIKDAWRGRYNADSLEKFTDQFRKQGEGKSFSKQDRYTLWTNYKDEKLSVESWFQKILADIPDNFNPQKDAPDFFDFVNGKSFVIKKNFIKVYTTDAFIKSDFESLMQAARTIVSSLYNSKSPAELVIVENKIDFDSIDVSLPYIGDEPDFIYDKKNNQEMDAKSFSFRIFFDLEIHVNDVFKDLSNINGLNEEPHLIFSLDFLALFFMHYIQNPSAIRLDKQSCVYFKIPQNTHDQDLINATIIKRRLDQKKLSKYDFPKELQGLIHFSDFSTDSLRKHVADLKSNNKLFETAKEYVEKYGRKGNISKSTILKHLKNAMAANPLDFIDHENGFVSAYARKLISGEN